VRALVISNMPASPENPGRGSFVRDQVRALRALGHDVELFAFAPGGARAYARAARTLRARYAHERFDVVHSHFGLTAWPAFAVRAGVRALTLHGTDLSHPRSGPITRAALPLIGLPATVSASLARLLPGAGRRRRVAVLPCGVDLERFRPVPRAEARRALALDPAAPFVLFPADPARPEKRVDRARAVAARTELVTLGHAHPDEVALWMNAANAVLIPSEREGFGLAALEALACEVPVLATPVGIAPLALQGIRGAHCGAFVEAEWRAALAPHLADPDPRVPGRARAELFSSERMAARVAAAWSELVSPPAGGGLTPR